MLTIVSNLDTGAKMAKKGETLSWITKQRISEAKRGVPHAKPYAKKWVKPTHQPAPVTRRECPPAVRAKISASNSADWIITFPDGRKERITNLRAFAKSVGLFPESLWYTSVYPRKYRGYKAQKLDL